MTYYVQLQEEIEDRIRSFVMHEDLQIERDRRRHPSAVPEEEFEKMYAALYAEYAAAKSMHDALVASFPAEQREWIMYEPYTPRLRDENKNFPATLAEWRRCFRKANGL